jgi:hypothetical protein
MIQKKLKFMILRFEFFLLYCHDPKFGSWDWSTGFKKLKSKVKQMRTLYPEW